MSRLVFYYAYAHLESDAVARALQQLAQALSDSGHPSVVYSARPTTRRRGVQQLTYAARAAVHMLTTCRRTVIVTVDVPTGIGLVGAVAARFVRAHHVALVMDLYQFQPDRPRTLVRRARLLLDRLSLRAAGQLITIGSCMADLIKRTTGRQSSVVPIWVPPQASAPSMSRSELGIDPNHLVLLYSGHAGEQHPLTAVIDAVCDRAVSGKVTLVIAGHGTAREAARVAASEKGASNVRFLDPVPHGKVPELLALGDVHIVSLAERATGTCVPSKTYTAMSAGRPVLYVGNANGQAAIDVSHVGGFVTSTVSDIIHAIQHFADSAALRYKVGAAGKHFSHVARSPQSQALQLITEIDRRGQNSR